MPPANRTATRPGDGPPVPTKPPKPTPLRPDFERMPPHLRGIARWVLWGYEWRDGKWTKPLYRADGHGYAASNRPETWATFEDARDAYERGVSEAAGVGWVVGEGITGVDVDACRDPEAGTLTEDAAAIVAELRTYTEVSPSGTGVRAFAFGELPPKGRKRGPFEMYDGDGGRYLTVTGHQLDGTPDDPEERTAELAVIHARHIARPEPKPSTNGEHRGARVATGKGAHLSDPDVLDRMRRAKPAAAALYDGDMGAYVSPETGKPDHSAADLALVSHLAWWTDYDAAQVDRLFRDSQLMRPKWNRSVSSDGELYGARTIRTAFEGRSPGDGYRPSAAAPADLEVLGRETGDEGPTEADAPAEGRASVVAHSPPAAKPAKANTSKPTPPRRPRLVRLDTVQAVPVEHLDDGRLALGKTTMLVGDPGSGKTHIALAIAAQITRGRHVFPAVYSPGSHVREPANVLALIGEDGLADTIRARFDAADGDPSRFVALTDVLHTDEDGKVRDGEVDLTQLDVLDAAMIEVRPALVIVDPVQVYLGPGADMHRANEVRAALKGAARLAEKHHASLLIIGHMNKSGGKALHRALGSVDFVAIARSVLVAGEHEGGPALAHAKANLSAKAATLTYTLADGHLLWTGTTDATADDLTGAPAQDYQAPQQARAAEWLETILRQHGGSARVADLEAWAKVAGVAWRTIKRAKDSVGITSRKAGTIGDAYWVWELEE